MLPLLKLERGDPHLSRPTTQISEEEKTTIKFIIWAASWQNQHSGFATSLIRAVWSGSMLFAISFFTCYRVCKRTAWMPIRLRGCEGWSGSMLVANALCWFCRDVAHFYISSLCVSSNCVVHFINCKKTVKCSQTLFPICSINKH
jgi:hypothetical protein